MSQATNYTIYEVDRKIFREINRNYEKNTAEIKEYLNKANAESYATNPAVEYLSETKVLGVLKEGIYQVLVKVDKTNSYYKQKTIFNGLDYLAEYLFNMNPKYPERKKLMAYIFDMDWVKDILKQRPRPFYKLSILWSEDTAAKKIQAFYRGYVLRKKLEVHEVRVFWKNLAKKTKRKGGG